MRRGGGGIQDQPSLMLSHWSQNMKTAAGCSVTGPLWVPGPCISSTKIGTFFWETLEWPLSSISEWKSLKARRLGILFWLSYQQCLECAVHTRSTPLSSNKSCILGRSTPTHLTRTKKALASPLCWKMFSVKSMVSRWSIGKYLQIQGQETFCQICHWCKYLQTHHSKERHFLACEIDTALQACLNNPANNNKKQTHELKFYISSQISVLQESSYYTRLEAFRRLRLFLVFCFNFLSLPPLFPQSPKVNLMFR